MKDNDLHLIANHPDWENLPKSWSDWQRINPSAEIAANRPVRLFRTHLLLENPDLRLKEGDGIVHAAPRPIFASDRKYDSSTIYGGGDRFTFITIYQAAPGQQFFGDEDLALSVAGHKDIPFETIEQIDKFDPYQHFETDAQGLRILGTYIVTLPEQESLLKPAPVNVESIKILRVDDKPEIIAVFNRLIDPTTDSAKKRVIEAVESGLISLPVDHPGLTE